MDIISSKIKLERARYLLNLSDEIINQNRYGEEQLALSNLREAEALISFIVETSITHKQIGKIIEPPVHKIIGHWRGDKARNQYHPRKPAIEQNKNIRSRGAHIQSAFHFGRRFFYEFLMFKFDMVLYW